MGTTSSQPDVSVTEEAVGPAGSSPPDGSETPPGVLEHGGSTRRGSSLGSIVPTVFTWSFGGHAVYVTGAWDNWNVKVPLARAGSEYSAVLSLPVGSYQYKFIVDGNWKHSPALPTETDQHGNLNNVVLVSPHLPEYDSNLPPTGMGGPPSPIESYDFSMPADEDYTIEPMALPPLFKTAPLDQQKSFSVSKFILNPTAYVSLNHAYDVAPTHPSEHVKTIATVCRYKKSKVVTTIMIVNAVNVIQPTPPVPVPIATEVEQEEQLAPHHPRLGTGRTGASLATPMNIRGHVGANVL